MVKKAIAIAYSDHHLNIWNTHSKRRLDDGLSVMKYMKLQSKLLKVPILFNGDLIHKEKGISNRLLSILLPFFSKLWRSSKYPTFAIDGNHDQCEENTLEHISPSYINTFSQIFPGLECINHCSVPFENLQIHGIPYLTHDLGLKEAIQQRIKFIQKNKINILMLHTTLQGAKDTDGREVHSHINKSVMKLLMKFDVVLTGHIHKPMKLGSNIFQIGAPNHQRKTDRHSDLGYCIIYSDLSVEYKHLHKFPKFIELEAGVAIPDTKNFYYHKEEVRETKSEVKHNFSDIENHTTLAKNYMKEKAIKDKVKRRALINILKSGND